MAMPDSRGPLKVLSVQVGILKTDYFQLCFLYKSK